jgi:hypothetical protein
MNERQRIALAMEDSFLRTYFGDNAGLLDFARRLIFVDEDKESLRELNRAVKRFGDKDADTIIRRINREGRFFKNQEDKDSGGDVVKAVGVLVVMMAWVAVVFAFFVLDWL